MSVVGYDDYVFFYLTCGWFLFELQSLVLLFEFRKVAREARAATSAPKRAVLEDPACQSKNCAANFRLGAARISIDREQFCVLKRKK